MDYEKKYKETLEKARQLCVYPTTKPFISDLQDLFPELKDSEDERIRKEIYWFFTQPDTVCDERWIAWLEKQGKKEQDARYENLEELLAADDIYQMAMNDEMVREAKSKAINALSELQLSKLLGLEKQGNPIDINPTEFDTRLQSLIGKFDSLPKEELIGSLSFWLNVVQNDGTYKEEKQGEQDMIPLDKAIKFLDEQLVNDKDEVTGEPFINFQNYGAFKETFISYFKRKMLEKQDEQKQDPCENCKDICLNCQNFPCIEKREFKQGKSALEAIKEEKVDNTNKAELKFKIGDVVCDKLCKQPNLEIVDIKNRLYICDKGYIPISQQDEYVLVAKKIEQKPVDKVKFKVGDWVVSPNGVYWHIDKISNNRYEVTSNTGESSNWNLDTNIYHKFTTQDIKDGDVLCSEQIILLFKNWEYNSDWNCVIAYAGIDITGKLQITNEHWLISNYAHPATKEQRDLLFQKIKEAGYEWDAEKKELKEIENEEVNGEDYGIDGLWHAQTILEKTLGKVDGYQSDDGILEHKAAITAVKKLYEQKPAWSEGDEEYLRRAINATKEVYPITSNWLKSLKQRIKL